MHGNPSRSRRRILLTIGAAVLLAPLVAMQFTDEVAWGPEDFVAAALLLGGAWAALELAWKVLPATTGRLIAAAGIVFAMLATWAHLAVGVF